VVHTLRRLVQPSSEGTRFLDTAMS
jgi:hypothetical protein